MVEKRTNLNELARMLNLIIKSEIKPTENELKNLLEDWLPNKQECILGIPDTFAQVELIFRCNAHGCNLMTDKKHHVRLQVGMNKPAPLYNRIKNFLSIGATKDTLAPNQALFKSRKEMLTLIFQDKVSI